MYSDRTLTEELKFQLRHGGMHIRLIFVNSAVFLAMIFLDILARATHNIWIEWFKIQFFTLQTNLSDFAYAPYGLLTSIFTHFSLLHFLFNMIFLYYAGILFRQFFSDRRMLHVYILGGVVGGIFELIANQFSVSGSVVLGASGSIMALFIAIAVHRPNMQINFFGLFPVKIYIIALIFLAGDLLQAFKTDGTAHFSHLGGALIGLLSVQNLHSSSNIINWTESIHQRILAFFSGRQKRPKMKVQSGGGRVVKTDEEYNMDAKARQARIDKILDKISKSGYESLTKAEKDFLFSQSNK